MKAQTALVCPLSWGLGHASRCIPIVAALQDAGIQVIIGANGRSGKLLREHFPELPFIETPFKEITLHKWLPAWVSILVQAPSLLCMVKIEREFVSQITKAHNIDLIISDNRYGLHSPGIPSIIITHQLRIMHPHPFKGFEWLTEKYVNKLCEHFTEIWIPDFSGDTNLSGKLSHTTSSKKNRARFIGPLSRFSNIDVNTSVIRNKIVVVISGPDPARQQFENTIKEKALKSGKAITIIGGRPDRAIAESVGLLTIYSHLNDEAFAREIKSAEYVIASGGYSTIMDMVSLGCCATIIPFKGQTEQKYLAATLHNNGQFLALSLNKLDFDSVNKWGISNIRRSDKPNYPNAENILKDAIFNLINTNNKHA